MTCKLSVNLNKVALLRNQRDIGYPSVVMAAHAVVAAGAHGITVHPRPDERHIRFDDVRELAAMLKDPRFTGIELNVEGYPDDRLMAIAEEVKPDQVTLVPDPPEAKTSEEGWRVQDEHKLLKGVTDALHGFGCRVSLFIDPDPAAAGATAVVGADRVEIYTGDYAMRFSASEANTLLAPYVETARAASDAGIGVNAGHDLNLGNLAMFMRAVQPCHEVSIGHAFTADALEHGWQKTTELYLAALKIKSGP